jgi:hypothetical protein
MSGRAAGKKILLCVAVLAFVGAEVAAATLRPLLTFDFSRE